MDSSNSLKKILKLLSHDLSYNMLNLATQQCFTLASTNPAANFVKIMDYYKALLYTKADSARTILPSIFIPQLIRFYNEHKDVINEHIINQRQKSLEFKAKIISQENSTNELQKGDKLKKRAAKLSNKDKEAANDTQQDIDLSISIKNDKNTSDIMLSNAGDKNAEEASTANVEESKLEQSLNLSEDEIYDKL